MYLDFLRTRWDEMLERAFAEVTRRGPFRGHPEQYLRGHQCRPRRWVAGGESFREARDTPIPGCVRSAFGQPRLPNCLLRPVFLGYTVQASTNVEDQLVISPHRVAGLLVLPAIAALASIAIAADCAPISTCWCDVGDGKYVLKARVQPGAGGSYTLTWPRPGGGTGTSQRTGVGSAKFVVKAGPVSGANTQASIQISGPGCDTHTTQWSKNTATGPCENCP